VYSPKIKEEIVRELYLKAKREGTTMTNLVNNILRGALKKRESNLKGVRENEKKYRMG
jgi:hypothetical protein